MCFWLPANVDNFALRCVSSTATTLQGCRFDQVAADWAASCDY